MRMNCCKQLNSSDNLFTFLLSFTAVTAQMLCVGEQDNLINCTLRANTKIRHTLKTYYFVIMGISVKGWQKGCGDPPHGSQLLNQEKSRPVAGCLWMASCHEFCLEL